MTDKDEINLPMAVIFTQFERPPPIDMLQQIDQAGIKDVYILLDEKKYKHAMNEKFDLDGTGEATMLEHYQSFFPTINFHVINTKDKNNEKQKLDFYLQNNKDQYLMNIFIANQSLPWVTPELRSSPLPRKITNYEIFGYTFYKKKSWSEEVYSLQAKSSRKALELLNRKNNPCYCHERSQIFDAPYSQWLFKIFMELTLLELAKFKQDHPFVITYKNTLKDLIERYYQNIIDQEEIEKIFQEIHQKVYPHDEKKYFKAREHKDYIKFQSLAEKRKLIWENFPDIINDLVYLYQEIHEEANFEMQKNKRLQR